MTCIININPAIHEGVERLVKDASTMMFDQGGGFILPKEGCGILWGEGEWAFINSRTLR